MATSFKQQIIYFCTALVLGLFVANSSFASVSSIMIDAKSGKVMSASDADSPRYPASLTKVMTLYITFDALEKGLIKFDDKLTVSHYAANRAPSRLGLKPGEKISVRDAVMAVVVKSANDCASVLAEGLGYSEDNFAKTMTKVAKELGMNNTTFKNASGLPNKQQKTTARDMATLGAAMYHHFPQYYKLFSTQSYTYKGKKIYTHNHVLKSFSGADGMKTGFTNASGYNIITSAERNGNRVIAVTMGHNTLKTRDTKVKSMMSQGLKKLALSNRVETVDIINTASAKPEIINAQTPSEPQQVALAEPEIEPSNPAVQYDENNLWGIQIGAFSNYAKARNYALQIKKEIRNKYSNKSINVEPAQRGAAIVYRSKLVGFAKNEANKACQSLKKTNKSCIVVASKANSQLVLANK